MIQLYRYTNPESKLYKRFISIFRHPLWNLYDFLLLIVSNCVISHFLLHIFYTIS